MKMNTQPKAVLRGKFIAIQAYLKKDRNISNTQPNPTSTRTGGTTTNKAQSEYIEQNNQDWVELQRLKEKFKGSINLQAGSWKR